MRHINHETLKHIAVSGVITLFLGFLFDSIFIGAILALILGILKEIYDHFKINKNTFLESLIDFAADILGTFLGYYAFIYFFE